MSKFYTSIERHGNNILYRGYEDGLPVQQKIPYRPHLFVDSKEESKYKLFNTNKNLTKKTFDSIKDMRDFTKSYEGIPNFGIYGCSDIVRQFTGSMFKGVVEWDYYQTKIWFVDIETTVGEAIDEKTGLVIKGFPNPEHANETIQLITLTEHHTNKIYTWSYKPLDKESENTISKEFPSFEYRAFDSEKEMLKDFIMFFRLSRVDVLSGWNCVPLTNSVWLKEKIVSFSDITYMDSLYDSHVEHVFPRSQKEKYEITLCNGQKTFSSAEHRFPISYVSNDRHIGIPTQHNMIERDVTASELVALLPDNSVFMEQPLHKNLNPQLTWRMFFLKNYKMLRDMGVSLYMRDHLIIKKLSNINCDVSWQLKNREYFSVDALINTLGVKEVENFILRSDVITAYSFIKSSTIDFVLDEEISEDLLWLAGMWYTDGCMPRTETGVSICNSNESIAMRAKRIVDSLYDKQGKPPTSPIHRSLKDNCFYVKCRGSILWILKSFIYDQIQNTNHNKKLNVELISQLSNNQFMAFYAGCVDGDGSVVDPTARIDLCNYNNDIPKFSELLMWNGIFNIIDTKENLVSCYIDDVVFNKNLTHDGKLERLNNGRSFSHVRNTKSAKIKWIINETNALVRIKSVINTYEIVEMGDIRTNTNYFISNSMKTHNCEQFDIPYLVNRIKKVLNETAASGLSPWGIVKPRTIKFEDKESIVTYDIIGVTHLDYIDLYKKFNPGSKESFKLDFIAEIELGKNKAPLLGDSFKESYDGTFEVTKINENSSLLEKLAYERTLLKLSGDTSSDEYLALDKEVKRLAWGKFVRYNIIDVDLLHHLELKMLQVRLAMQLGFLAKCKFSDVLSAMRLWESIIYNYFLDLNIVEVYEKDHNERHSIIGGYVKDPKPDKYGWTFSLDFTSMYPSIMMQNNLSPETILDYLPDGAIEDMIWKTLEGKYAIPEVGIRSANGLITSTDSLGFIPILVKRTFDYRKQTKNLMLEKKKEFESRINLSAEERHKLMDEIASLDVTQSAYKTASNAFFGILLLPYFKYYDYRLGEAITSTGQVFIKHAGRWVDSLMSKITGINDCYTYYSDTDSNYVEIQRLVDKYCVGKSETEIVTFIEKFVVEMVQPKLNVELSKFAKTMGVDECKMYMKLECIGPALVMKAPKKYAFDILYSEGVRYKEAKMKVMGIEIVRSSTPSVVKDSLKKTLALCLRGTESDVQKKVKEIQKEFMTYDYQQISFPRGCNGLSTYASNSSIYQKGCPMQVRGALLYNHHLKKNGLDSKYPLIGDGEKIKFVALKMPNPIHENVIAFPGKLPKELGLEKYVDYKVQFQKAFVKPMDDILECIGWTSVPVITLDC